MSNSAQLLTIQEAATKLKVSIETLRRWDARGFLVPIRTPGNQRRYTLGQIEAFQQRIKKTLHPTPPPKPKETLFSSVIRETQPVFIQSTVQSAVILNPSTRLPMPGTGGQALLRVKDPCLPAGRSKDASLNAQHDIGVAQNDNMSYLASPSNNFGEHHNISNTQQKEQKASFFSRARENNNSTGERVSRVGLASAGIAVVVFALLAIMALLPFGKLGQSALLGSLDKREAVSGGNLAGVLAADSTLTDFQLGVNIPAIFTKSVNLKKGLEVTGGIATLSGGLVTNNQNGDFGTGIVIASNIPTIFVDSVVAGSGVTVNNTDPRNPTIANTGVLSLQGSTGAVNLTAGSGIAISGLTISSTVTAPSASNSFANIAVSSQSTLAAGSPTDTLTFVAGSNVTLTTDTGNKSLTINASGTSQWTTNGTSIYYNSGNVGIGTSTPLHVLELGSSTTEAGGIGFGSDLALFRGAPNRLDLASGDRINLVSGSIEIGGTTILTATSLVQSADGNAGSPSHSFALDTASGMFSSGTGLLGFATNGAERVRINSSGNVGIGKTNPTQALDVTGSILASGTIEAASNFIANGTSGITIGSPACVTAVGGIVTGSGSCSGGGGGGSNWNVINGALSPIYPSADVLIGSSATTSAKFAFMNVSSGIPTASISGNIVLNSAGSIQATKAQQLTIGGSTTGQIVFSGRNGNATGITFSGYGQGVLQSDTSGVINSSPLNLAGGSNFVTGTLPVGNGGSGATSFTSNGVLYGNGSGAIQVTAAGTNGTVLKGNTGGAPTFGQVVLTTDVSGVLPIANGGTNAATIGSAGSVAYSNGTAYAFSGAGSSGQCLLSGGTGSPTWSDCGSASGDDWDQFNGALYPKNSTVDLLIGGTSSASAKFAILNMNSGTPVASLSATTTGLALNAGGSIQSLRMGTLTLGGTTTGNIQLAPGGSTAMTLLGNGNVGIGLTNPSQKLYVYESNNADLHLTLETAGTTKAAYIDLIGTNNNFGGIKHTANGSDQWFIGNNGNTSGSLNFYTSSSLLNRMMITSTGNIGIGTTTPLALLDIAGNASASGNLTLYGGARSIQGTAMNSLTLGGNTTGQVVLSGRNASPTGITFSGYGQGVLQSDTNSIISSAALNLSGGSSYITGTLPIANGGTNSGSIGSAGSVAYSDGTAYAFTSVGSAGQILVSNGVGAPTWIAPGGTINFWQRNLGVLSSLNITDDLLVGGTATSSALVRFGGTTNANSFINTGGNVGIGTTTPTSFKLEVAGNIGPDSNGARDIGSPSRVYNAIYVNNIFPAASGTQGYWQRANNAIAPTNITDDILIGGSATSSALIRLAGTTNTNSFFNGSGNLGVGTDTPGAKFHVVGDEIRFTGNNGSVAVQLLDGGSSDQGVVQLRSGGAINTKISADSSVDTFFNAGNVGIGTTTPLAKLDVNGNATVSGNLNLAGGARSIQTNANNSLTLGGNSTGNIVLSPLNGAAGSTVAPSSNNQVDLGTTSLAFRNIYAGTDIQVSGISVCLASGTNCPSGAVTYWDQVSGALYPKNSTVDLLIGGTSTASAKFAFLNNNSGTPTASIAGNIVLSGGNRTIQTTSGNTLTLGGSTTGTIVIDSGTGNISLADNITASGTFTGNGLITAAAGFTVNSGQNLTLLGITGNNAVLYGTSGSGIVTAATTNSTSQCLLSGASAPSWGTCPGGTGSNWTVTNGVITPNNATLDLTIGGQSSASAKFAVLNVNSGTPVASVAGNIVLSGGARSIQGTANNTLTIGGNTTGQVILSGNNGGPSGITLAGYGAGVLQPDGSGILTSAALNLAGGSTYVIGILPIANGGTNAATIGSAGGIAYSNGTAYAFSGVGSSGQCLTSGGSGSPTWVDCGAAGGDDWDLANGTLYPKNSTVDLLVGGTSTASAKFGVLNVNGSGPATATVSGSMIVMPLNGAGGNIGIGKATPGTMLHILGAQPGITLANPTFNSANSGTIDFMEEDLTFDGGGTGFRMRYDGSTTNNIFRLFSSSNSNILNVERVSGNLGIGTTTPLALLDIAGNASASGNLTLYGGARSIQGTAMNSLTLGGNTTGNIFVNPRNGTSGGIFGPGVDNVTSLGASATARFRDLFVGPSSLHIQCTTGDGCGGAQGIDWGIGVATSGTGKNALQFGINRSGFTTGTPSLTLAEGGNVGIGTSTPTKGLLEIASTGSPIFAINGGATGQPQTRFLQNGSTVGFLYYDNTNALMTLNQSGTNGEGLTVNSSGNVGIGSGATNPGAALHVIGTEIRLTGNNGNTAFQILDGGSNDQGTLQLRSSGTTNTVISADSTVATYFNAGNVGIGTTVPRAKLDVAGAASVSGQITVLGGNNINIQIPDGLEATPVHRDVSSSVSYTVPTGKTFYLIGGYNASIATRNVEVDGVAIVQVASGGDYTLDSPVLIEAGAVVDTNGTQNTSIHGFIVDQGVTPTHQTVSSAVSYTVPAGKTLYITHVYNEAGATRILELNDVSVASIANVSSLNFTTPVSVESGGKVDTSGTGNVRVHGYLTDGAGVGGADLAEQYFIIGGGGSGDVVSVSDYSTNTFPAVERSVVARDPKIAGIIAKRPGIVLSNRSTTNPDSEKPVLAVALAGRVPVKVTSEKGPIRNGDGITSSSLSGFGTKATQAGTIVGKALEPFTPSDASCPAVANISDIIWPEDNDGANESKPCFKLPDGTYVGKVLAFVNTSYNDPDVYITDTGNISVIEKEETLTGLSRWTVRKGESGEEVKRVGLFSDVFTASLSAGIVDAREIRVNGVNVLDLINSLGNQPASPSAQTGDLSVILNEMKDLKDASLNAQHDIGVAQNDIETLQQMQAQIASETAFLRDILANGGGSVLGASSSASLGISSGEETTVSGDLTVLGRTRVTDVGITGSLTAGVLTINGLDDCFEDSSPSSQNDSSCESGGSLNTIGGPLRIQSLAVENIDIMDGKVVIKTNGDISTKGEVTAKKINIDESDEQARSIGEVTIEAGENSIEVTTSALTDKSKIFVTSEEAAAVGAKKVGDTKFRIELKEGQAEDLKVNWWVVN